jgi:hypothetical protein
MKVIIIPVLLTDESMPLTKESVTQEKKKRRRKVDFVFFFAPLRE